MRSKTPLVLMEQLVMVLVFALAAALCLQAFVLAQRISRQNELRDGAVTTAQTMAETLKHTHGDYGAAAALAGGTWDGHTWGMTNEEAGMGAARSGYVVLALPAETGDSLLGGAEITALTGQGDWLFSLAVAWQEEGSHG